MKISTVGIIGAGTMGTGIAQNVAEHGLSVLLLDTDPALVRRALDQIRGALDDLGHARPSAHSVLSL